MSSKYPNPSFWNGNQPLQDVLEELQKLIPDEGAVKQPRKNRMLEKLRVASNCYYDLYNNGLCNRATEFRKVMGFSAMPFRYRRRYYFAPGRYSFTTSYREQLYSLTEEKMVEIVRAAAVEQGIALPQ